MHRRLLSAAASGALLLGLAACGDPDDGPVTTPPPDLGIEAPSDGGGDADPSDGGGETGEPTADAPDIPPPDPADFAGMDENTPEGAEQAFKHYIAVSMWAHQTGDESLLKDLEGGDCGGCDYLNGDIEQIRESGIYWSDMELSETGTAVHESSNFDHEIGYVFTLGKHTRPDSNFAEELTLESLEYTAIGGMNWVDDEWAVGELSIEWGDDVYQE